MIYNQLYISFFSNVLRVFTENILPLMPLILADFFFFSLTDFTNVHGND